MNKKGSALADGTISIIRIILVAFIAFVVLGLSNWFYAVYIDVRDTEAVLMSRNVADCLSPEGVLNLDGFSDSSMGNLLDYCGIRQSERFYIEAELFDSNKNSVGNLTHGDVGQLWALKILGSRYSDGLKKYTPGYYTFEYPTYFVLDGVKQSGIVKMEVLVNHEF
jgi:hypothetical protein